MAGNKKVTRPERRVTDYQNTFNTVEGRRVLLDMMSAHGMLSPGFHKDALEMARIAGERNVILRILSILSITEKQLMKMMEEANELIKADVF